MLISREDINIERNLNNLKRRQKMAKEWILNMATNRWKLNQKNSVGPVSEWIR